MDELIAGHYNEGFSASRIAAKLNIPMWRVYKVLKKKGIQRRSSAASNKLTFLLSPKSFAKRPVLNVNQELIWHAGLLLYLGEGSKRDSKTVDLANSDPNVVLIFLRMLREVYCVNESRLRVLIYCHENSHPDELIKYWSTVTRIPPEQFTKPYVKSGFSGKNSDKMKNGLIHIRYSDKRLWVEIMADLNLLIKNLLG